MHPAPLRKSEAALLFNIYQTICVGTREIRILNVLGRKMNTKSLRVEHVIQHEV